MLSAAKNVIDDVFFNFLRSSNGMVKADRFSRNDWKIDANDTINNIAWNRVFGVLLSLPFMKKKKYIFQFCSKITRIARNFYVLLDRIKYTYVIKTAIGFDRFRTKYISLKFSTFRVFNYCTGGLVHFVKNDLLLLLSNLMSYVCTALSVTVTYPPTRLLVTLISSVLSFPFRYRFFVLIFLFSL